MNKPPSDDDTTIRAVTCPSMKYETLKVSNGTEAQVTWNAMIPLPPGAEKKKLTRDLLKYCGQDTLAMVEINKKFLEDCYDTD